MADPTKINGTAAVIAVACIFSVTFLGAFYMYLHKDRSSGVTVSSTADPRPSTNAASQTSSQLPQLPTKPVYGWTNPSVQHLTLGAGRKSAIGPLDIHDHTVKFRIESDSAISFGVTNGDWKDTIVGNGDWIGGAALDDHRSSCFHQNVNAKSVACSKEGPWFNSGAYVAVQDGRIPPAEDTAPNNVTILSYYWQCVQNCR